MSTERLAYSLREAAQVLGLSERSMWELLRNGRIRAVRTGTRGKWLVPKVALEDFLRSAGGCDQSEFGQHDAER